MVAHLSEVENSVLKHFEPVGKTAESIKTFPSFGALNDHVKTNYELKTFFFLFHF